MFYGIHLELDRSIDDFSGAQPISTVAPIPLPSTAVALIEKVRDAFRALPDGRKQSNARLYEMEDAALSAFAVFFSQSPSFLDSQVRMQKPLGRNNASSLFGVYEIPCDNQIRNLLDPVPPETVYPVLAEIGDALYQQGYLAGFRSINDPLLIALDGTDFFFSEKISCGGCRETRLKNDRVTTDARGAIVFKNAWATSHAITDHNVAARASAGRARWKIENENHNTLQTKGDHFDHHFGHDKQFLANRFATLILLAFLVHTALDSMDTRDAKVRGRLPSRRTFFEHLRA